MIIWMDLVLDRKKESVLEILSWQLLPYVYLGKALGMNEIIQPEDVNWKGAISIEEEGEEVMKEMGHNKD